MVILVMLASCDGEKYLSQQVNSIFKQKNVAVNLVFSDDSESKDSIDFLRNVSVELGVDSKKIKIIKGPRQGANANFAHLISSVDISNSVYFAFSDQDDVWQQDKLCVAKEKLATVYDIAKPSIYMGRTMVCDMDLNPLFLSKGKPRPASFRNALLESIAGGNTMVFNQTTLALLKKAGMPVHHDWLSYMVVTACGGTVIFDDEPYVLYRQHDANVIGANNGFIQKWYRLKKLLSNDFRSWVEDNIEALKPLVNDMTADSRLTYEGFVQLHDMRGWYRCLSRLFLFKKLGLYRQRRFEHWGFALAAFLGKI
ncbi:glycosyltransferase [Hydromonas duriensis]|uniref:Glycosyl transferase family 2 n=1 Tax=Hydromonas duriensis TaxID=1527608 RepID=A0A4R6Y895_9BURK|nr:glycosyltransferase [Hydromonas duriensis]TDR31572.1 glycosyl transferase family 2 [Hydromonas duriensis]